MRSATACRRASIVEGGNDSLDTDRRGGPDPDAITLESFGREIPEA